MGMLQYSCMRGMQRAQVQTNMDAYRSWYQRWVQNIQAAVGGYASSGWGSAFQPQQQMMIMPWSWRMRGPDWSSQAESGFSWF